MVETSRIKAFVVSFSFCSLFFPLFYMIALGLWAFLHQPLVRSLLKAPSETAAFLSLFFLSLCGIALELPKAYDLASISVQQESLIPLLMTGAIVGTAVLLLMAR